MRSREKELRAALGNMKPGGRGGSAKSTVLAFPVSPKAAKSRGPEILPLSRQNLNQYHLPENIIVQCFVLDEKRRIRVKAMLQFGIELYHMENEEEEVLVYDER